MLFLYFMSKKENFANNENEFIKRGTQRVNVNSDQLMNPNLNKDEGIKNIYGLNLSPCMKTNQESSGNFNSNGMCPYGKSEEDRTSFDCPKTLCKDLKPRFCMKFGQMSKNFAKYVGNRSNWSLKYDNDETNCVKLGEYSYYKFRQDKKEIFSENKSDLVCSAIPETVFNFMEDWNKGYGYPKTDKNTNINQSINGMKSLFNQCFSKGAQTPEEKVGFLNRFCRVLKTSVGEDMIKNDKSARNEQTLETIYSEYCENIDNF